MILYHYNRANDWSQQARHAPASDVGAEVDAVATRSGWYYNAKKRDIAVEDDAEVDAVATRSGWYYNAKRDAAVEDGAEVDAVATRSGWYYNAKN